MIAQLWVKLKAWYAGLWATHATEKPSEKIYPGYSSDYKDWTDKDEGLHIEHLSECLEFSMKAKTSGYKRDTLKIHCTCQTPLGLANIEIDTGMYPVPSTGTDHGVIEHAGLWRASDDNRIPELASKKVKQS